MSRKIDVGVFGSKKSSMVSIHETTSPTISIKLNGANYRGWSQILEMHIAGRYK